ncbi:protein kinase domain-containing protein [Virgibacillus kimchii]
MNGAWKKKHNAEIRPGVKLTGKWHGQSYLIKKKLGEGAIGSVYLCEANGKKKALKISDNRTSMTMEVNVLKSLGKVQGNRLGPSLLDVDDWVSPFGTAYTFYVMEYLHGEPLSSFISRNGSEWLGVFMLQLLDDLERLHSTGWVFGDLKTENLLVLHAPPRVRWIDVGGTTQIGRAIKEYTEFYDRGYWKMGSRKAEPSYDLFAFVMIFLHIYYPKRFDKGTEPEKTLLKKLHEVKPLRPYKIPLQKALQGKYRSSAEMKKELMLIFYRAQKRSGLRKNRGKESLSHFFIEISGITAIAVGYYLFSLLL